MQAGRLRSQPHLFQRNGRALLFDPSTRASFALDAAGEVAAREMLGGVGQAPSGPTDRAEIAAARGELEELYARGHFRDFQPPPTPLHPLRIGFPMPVISRACNLRCRHCFVNRAGPMRMSREVMQAVAASTAARAVRDGMSSHTVWIASVGEPTAYLSQYSEFRELLWAEGRKHGVELTTGIGITNGTVTADPAVGAWLDELALSGHARRVSLDGPPAAHDALRVHADGRARACAALRLCVTLSPPVMSSSRPSRACGGGPWADRQQI